MDLDRLVMRFREQDRQALSRLLSLAARGEHLDAIRRLVAEPNGAQTAGEGKTLAEVPPDESCRVVAITGSPGVGKSTLVGRLIEVLRRQGRRVAVLACDPQSPLTGGALLGDRVRMPARPDDPDLFIRSLATPGGLGAIPENIALMVGLLKAYGFDWVILETVGAGQGETAVRHVADVVVLLVQPEAGDDIQWEKAGLFEIADIVVVHKADLPQADRVEAQIRSLLNLPGAREVPVLRVSSHKGQGVEELVRLFHQRGQAARDGQREALAQLRELVLGRLLERWQRVQPELAEVARLWRAGQLSEEAAVAAVWRYLEPVAGLHLPAEAVSSVQSE